MNAALDLQVLEDWLLTRFPTATCIKHRLPEELVSHRFFLSFMKEERGSETAATVRVQRQYEIGYWHQDPEEVLAVMEDMAAAWYVSRRIGSGTASHALRLISFTYAPMPGTTNELYGCLGTLTVERRYQLEQEPVVKMAKIKTAFQ